MTNNDNYFFKLGVDKERGVKELVTLWRDILDQLDFAKDNRKPIEIVASWVWDELSKTRATPQQPSEPLKKLYEDKLAEFIFKNVFPRNMEDCLDLSKAICSKFGHPSKPLKECKHNFMGGSCCVYCGTTVGVTE